MRSNIEVSAEQRPVRGVTLLPRLLLLPGGEKENARPVFEALGFQFLEGGADLYSPGHLPPGWYFGPQRGPTRQYVYDERGNHRASIYEDLFVAGEEDVRLNLRTRYNIYRTGGGPGGPSVLIAENETNVATFSKEGAPEYDADTSKAYWTYNQAQVDAAEAFLDQVRPFWREPHAYWTAPPVQIDSVEIPLFLTDEALAAGFPTTTKVQLISQTNR